jgi:hypothetical protein
VARCSEFALTTAKATVGSYPILSYPYCRSIAYYLQRQRHFRPKVTTYLGTYLPTYSLLTSSSSTGGARGQIAPLQVATRTRRISAALWCSAARCRQSGQHPGSPSFIKWIMHTALASDASHRTALLPSGAAKHCIQSCRPRLRITLCLTGFVAMQRREAPGYSHRKASTYYWTSTIARRAQTCYDRRAVTTYLRESHT